MAVKLRKKKLNDGRRSLYLDIYLNGKRSYKFLNLYTKRGSKNNREILDLAEKIRAEKELTKTFAGYKQISKSKSRVSFIKYFENFVKDKNKTSNFYSAFKHLQRYANGKDLKFKDIDTEWLENYAAYLKSTKLKPNSVFVYFRILKTVLFNAAESDYIDKTVITNMSKGAKPQKVKTNFGYLEDYEVQKLIDVGYKDSEIKRAFLFSCFTGLRQSDVRNLKWGNIKNGYFDIKVIKTKKPLKNKLNKNALEIIEDNLLHLPDTNVFKLIKDRTSINRHLTKWFKDAGIEKRAFYHISRHTFGTTNVTAGNDIYVIMKLMGHEDIKITQMYADVVKKKRDEAIDKLPEFSL